MSNTYIIAHYKILSIMNLVLFLSFCEIINLFLSSVFCAYNLFIKSILIMPFYYSQFFFLINNDM